ncbi:MAG: bifunctional phosphopantothenoylcysteine decarboxylase/phosphopantothenate--cysteine ligase CoaBC [Actinobacteria bacterium]|nr:bifunctional phosphopantothenoylcysteine decarboxylase/phosphopantothenate--cysteine ligase CoaBC [Actinomycetota bacterium]
MKNTRCQIVLGVTGSIAAVKAVELARLLAGAGHNLRVILTGAGSRFVGESSLAAASGHPVMSLLFGDGPAADSFAHIELARADLLVIAPATANTIGKMAAGIADNLLLTTYLAASCPVMICPAMNHYMWHHPAVQHNIRLLDRRGIIVVPPEPGVLACGETGDGRLASPQEIFCRIQALLGEKVPGDLEGLRVLVTAGGTREPIDAVRFISNRSSGKMGFAIAAAACRRGAEVTVVAANVGLSRQPDINYIDVTTAAEMRDVLNRQIDRIDILLMAAAVSDYKVSGTETKGKLQREDKIDLQLIPTSDIVSGLGTDNTIGLKVGFAAEYGEEEIERARRKLNQKKLDMIIFNDISRHDIGFEADENEVTVITGERDVFISKRSKEECANRILDLVAEAIR